MNGATLTVEMVALGVVASFVGSVVGLGGGFVVIPVLRLAFGMPPSLVAGTSLVLVTANVASASLAFWRQRRIDVRLGLAMGLPAIVGSIAGALALRHVAVAGFDVAYAAILVFVALDLFRLRPAVASVHPRLPNDPLLAVVGLVTGFVSSLFGIGGGIIVVPLLLRVFALPAHVVGATSQFIILLSSPAGVATHGLGGDIAWRYAWPLAAGGVLGAQFGAATARRLSSPALVRALAIVMLLAAGSLAIRHVGT